jgi:sugar transferase (PEP-CTERM system associated)
MRFVKLSVTTTGSALFLLDLLLIALAWPGTLWVGGPTSLALFGTQFDTRVLTYPLAVLLMFYAMGLYRRDAILEPRKTAARIPLVVGMGGVLSIIVSVIAGLSDPKAFGWYGGRDQAMLFGLATVALTFAALGARIIFTSLLHLRILHRRLLVIGAGNRAYDLMRMLTKEGSNLQYDVVFLQEPAMGEVDDRLRQEPGVRILMQSDCSMLEAARLHQADEIVVAPDDRRGMDLHRLLDCKKAGFPVVQYLTFIEAEIRRIDIKRLEVGWLVFSEGFTFSAIDRFLKRTFDLVVSSLVLVLTAPLLLGGMLAIRWEGPGPVFYRQERVTQDNRVFWILKLRTMRVDAEAGGAVWAATQDNRITKVGNFLRRAPIDELPQLVNILRGEMSFVGPRPERPMFVADLAEKIPLYNERHLVKAGLTGWAQVNYPYGASVEDARSKLSYDLYYVKNFSILFDFVILLQTLREVLWPSGVR